jgi:hypothetical protein
MYDKGESYFGHSFWHYFEFRKVKGVARMRYKLHHCTDEFYPDMEMIDRSPDPDLIHGLKLFEVLLTSFKFFVNLCY